MNFRIYTALLIGLLSIIHISCSTDIDLGAPEKELMAVYGLLDPNSNEQYIKIYKVFNSTDSSALVLAADPEEIYYADGDLEVTIFEVNTNRSFSLNQVNLSDTEIGDLDQLGPFNSGGAFPQNPNIAYKGSFTPREGEEYEIRIVNSNTGLQVRSKTTAVESYRVLQPFGGVPWRTTAVNVIKLQWERPSENRIFDVNVHLYNELRNADFSEVVGNETLQVPLARTIYNDELNITSDVFYRLFASNIAVRNDDYIRRLDSVKVSVTTGNKDFADYINFNKAQSSAGASQSLSLFTNIENGVGVFGSRTQIFTNAINFTQPSLDTLACGEFTNQLRFAVFQNIDVNPNFPFCD